MICTVKDLPIYYEIHGEGFPILMLHGFVPDHRLMTGCMEPIFARLSGWKRIYLDLPGMGQTPGREWIVSSGMMLQVVLEFIDQILPGQPFLVVGESYGAYLARGIIWAIPERVEGVCLICPCIIAEHSRRTCPPHQVLLQDKSLLVELPAEDAEQFTSVAIIQDRASWQRFSQEILPGLRAADRSFLENLRTSAYDFHFAVDQLEQPFEKPALFLLGRQDSSVGYRDAWQIIENYPRAAFVVLDRAGHNLQIEQPVLFEALVHEWLERARIERVLPPIMALLKQDEIQNASLLYFLQENPVQSVERIGNSVLLRGISDRAWVYISCPRPGDFPAVLARLTPEDHNFAMVEDWMLPWLKQHRQMAWQLSARKLFLPPDAVLTHVPRASIRPLAVEEADYMYTHYHYQGVTSPDYLRQRITRAPSGGIEVDGKLVAWVILHDDGAIGALHVLDDYRRKGYATDLMAYMIQQVRALGRVPFVQVEESNHTSMSLMLKLGFQSGPRIHWFELQ